jgi:hypothetical protein
VPLRRIGIIEETVKLVRRDGLGVQRLPLHALVFAVLRLDALLLLISIEDV